jgi:hypothetical protein
MILQTSEKSCVGWGETNFYSLRQGTKLLFLWKKVKGQSSVKFPFSNFQNIGQFS